MRRLLAFFLATTAASAAVRLDLASDAAPRVRYGAEQLRAAFASLPAASGRVLVRKTGEASIAPEGFLLTADTEGVTINGADDSGALYGCLELARRVRETGRLPAAPFRFADAPAFKLRGPCIGMQKTYILPGRKVYEYPYTPELFPFFYDEKFWHDYLDFLAAQRMNVLYLWAGHPFASLVKLADYPEALEVPDDVFAKNTAAFRFLAQECDRRGIWLLQMFYNILLPKPFAEKYGLATQLKAPVPVAADYTRKAIAEFVRQYPNVGLMPCLGEALQGTPNQIAWATEVILPGVHDGMKAAGLTAEPPVVFRTHAMNPEAIIPEALKVYSNLFTETKFNGESLTTWEPRGKGQATHLAMAKLGPHLVNIHILSNLEPFRYGATEFIRKSMLAARDRLGATGLHLYPLSYWNWPDAPDKTAAPLKQWERDWIWFEAWARYAWNPDVDAATDRAHWLARIADHYGRAGAEKILDAYNDAGECAPRLIRRFGITEGNRQTLSLGMTLDELVRPERYSVLPDLWESQSPPGERLQDYIEREWNHQPHAGETPPQIIAEVLDFSARSVAALDAAAPLVTKNADEFARLRNDAACIRAMSQNYSAKANAALCVLRYAHSHDIADMEHAENFLAESLDHYRTLARLTADTYLYANSMQTSQRRIPVPGGVNGQPANFHWTQLLPLYEGELADFTQRVAALKQGAAGGTVWSPLTPAKFTLLGRNAETYPVQVGARLFSDNPLAIRTLAPELEGLTGIRVPLEAARAGRYAPIEFSCEQPVRVLVGFFESAAPGFRRPPTLETDAAAAEHGGTEPLLAHAATIDTLPAVNVHAFEFLAGHHQLELRGTGSFVILGVAAASGPMETKH